MAHFAVPQSKICHFGNYLLQMLTGGLSPCALPCELQRIIALHGGIKLSVDKVIDIAKTVPTIKLSLPYGDTERVKTLFLTEKHQRIKPLFDIKAILDKKQD